MVVDLATCIGQDLGNKKSTVQDLTPIIIMGFLWVLYGVRYPLVN